MAIDFPSSPTVGQKYIFAGVTYTFTTQGVWASSIPSGGGGGGTVNFSSSATPPINPNEGDYWYDLTTGILAAYVDDDNSKQWVQVSPPLPPSPAQLLIPSPNAGRLTFVSATQLAFKPFNGDLLKINGILYKIPTAGIVGLSNTNTNVNSAPGSNLAANTTYLVSVFPNGGILTANFVVIGAGHSTSTTAGNIGTEIVAGGDNYSLVGMVQTNASAQFQDDEANRFVLSWFNRRGRNIKGAGTANATLASAGGFQEINAPNSRINFIIWGEEGFSVAMTGSAISDTALATIASSIRLDISTVITTYAGNNTYPAASVNMAVGIATSGSTTEGFHMFNPMGSPSAGNSTWNVALTGILRG